MPKELPNNTRVWVPAIEQRPEEPNAFYADHLSRWHEAPALACEHIKFLEEEVRMHFADGQPIPVYVERYDRTEEVKVVPGWQRTYQHVPRATAGSYYKLYPLEPAHVLTGSTTTFTTETLTQIQQLDT
jgi:hypothetical protein